MNEELVTIATYPTPSEAAVARIALEAEGINVFINNDLSSALTRRCLPASGSCQAIDAAFLPSMTGAGGVSGGNCSTPLRDRLSSFYYSL